MTDRHARHRRADRSRRRRPPDGFRTPTSSRFDRLVNDAVRSLPPGLLSYLDGVQLAVADVPPADPLSDGDEVLLGRYEPPGTVPGPPESTAERLVLFRRPLEARASDRLELMELVRHAVVDQLAVRFGLDDDRLEELGWR